MTALNIQDPCVTSACAEGGVCPREQACETTLELGARRNRLVEGRWAGRREGASALDDSVRQGEAKVWHKQLLDVGSADIGGLLDLCNAQNLLTAE